MLLLGPLRALQNLYSAPPANEVLSGTRRSRVPGPRHLVPPTLPVRGLDQGLANGTSNKVLTIPQNRGDVTL